MPRVVHSGTESQREQAYNALRRLLVLQQIEPGQRLREPHWAERLGVHRSALREAFARLHAEGLLTRGEQTGYFVPTLTPADLVEITKLRLAFESLAIDELCQRADRQALEPLARACDELQQFQSRGYTLGVMEADRRFHEALIDAAGMKRLSQLYHRAPLPLLAHETQDQRAREEEATRTLAEHRMILAAVARSDAEEAKRILRGHLLQRSILPIRH